MLTIKDSVKIYIYLQVVDMRKAVNGLSALILDEFSETPVSGHVFVFHNKARNKIKCLFWDQNGFVLYYKRMEKRKFLFPINPTQEHVEITPTQLQGLLAGFDFMLMSDFSEIKYSQFY